MQGLNKDFVDYMRLLSRKMIKLSNGRQVKHSGQRLLKDYEHAGAIKAGYTRASGFSRAIIADKMSDRIIVVVFGGKSTKTRNAQMIKLAELGFRKLQ